VRMTLVASDGRWSLLRDDPRYADVLRQMKLSPRASVDRPEKS
jgi:hypothetical protein